MHPGNPIQSYMKCIMEQKKFFFDKEAFQHRENLLTKPLEELPDDDRYDLRQIDWAARLDAPDWQILRKLKADGIEAPFPEVQSIRAMQRALQVRFRTEIAQGRFDDAIRTAKTFFAMSRHLGQHPTLVGNLVGMAIAAVAIDHLFWQVESLNAQIELKKPPPLFADVLLPLMQGARRRKGARTS